MDKYCQNIHSLTYKDTHEHYYEKKYDIKGIKLCGAGGGGYFLILTKDTVEEGTLINIDNKGVQAWEL